MGTHKMGNGSMMAIKIEWADDGLPSIVEARMMYGTKFAEKRGKGSDEDDRDEDDTDDGGASSESPASGGGATPPPRPPPPARTT